MKTLTKIMYTGLLALVGFAKVDGQVKTTSGYNAVQIGITDDKTIRERSYTNLGLKYDNLTLGVHGLNEAGKDYLFGRETIKAGVSLPVEIIYTTRFCGTNFKDLKQIDQGVGIRLNKLDVDVDGAKIIDYGWVDVVKHIDKDFKGLEAVVFAGKSIGEGAIEATMSLKTNGQRYIEFEALTPGAKIGHGTKIRVYGRVELPGMNLDNPTAVAGVQMQF